MPPKRKAPAKATSARQVRSKPASSAPPPASPPASIEIEQTSPLALLPSKLLDLIASRLRRAADRAALARTCKPLWARWGRPADWPLATWADDLPAYMPEKAPLFRLEGVKKGEPGFAPFYVDTAGRAGQGEEGDKDGAVVLNVVELRAEDLHRCDRGEVSLESEKWIRKLSYDQGGEGKHVATTHVFDWETNRCRMVSATQDWLKSKYPCPTCKGKRQVTAGSKAVSTR